MRAVTFICANLLMGVALAVTTAYDETADAKAAVQQALVSSKADGRPVLLVFGANWCEDCRALDAALKSGKAAEQVAHNFRVVKIDVGQFDRNIDLSKQYGEPTKNGIPAAVLLSANNQVLYATRAGELANARRMSETGIADFFRAIAASTAAR